MSKEIFIKTFYYNFMQKQNNVIKNYILISEPITINYNDFFKNTEFKITDNLKYHKLLMQNKV